MLNALLADFRIIFERDPAARSRLEVLLCYPGLQALLIYRLAHGLHRLHLPLIARFLSHLGRFLTGIEIHPGAIIGKGMFIDHGMGVVVGETAIIGDYALIYQGVTLGGTGKQLGKRHPTLGDNVVVGAGAKVLGNLTIGDNVRIGAGSVVLRDVPSDCTVVGIPGRIVYRAGAKVSPLEHGNLPDSEAQVIRTLLDRIEALEEQVQNLQSQPALPVRESVDRHLVASFLAASATSQSAGDALESLCGDRTHPERTHPERTHPERTHSERTQCLLKDREIEQFLDGSGI